MNIKDMKTDKALIRTVSIPDNFGFKDFRRFRSIYADDGVKYSEFILDTSGVNIVESFGLAMLLQMSNYFHSYRPRICIVNCNESLYKLLQHFNFDRLFELNPSNATN